MKLVTFDAGRVGRLEGEGDDAVVVELECASTREWFQCGGQAGETGERLPLAQVRLRAPIVPKKFFHTVGNFADHHEELQAVDWSHPVHKGIVFFQNVDAIIGPDDAIVYPEGLTKELDYELELAIIIGKAGKFFGPDDVRGVHGFQRHHRPRHPAPRDAVRRLLVLQGDRHLLPDRPVDRDRRRGTRRPGAGHGTAGQRPGTAARQHGQDAHLHPAPGRVPLGAGLFGRGHPHHRDDLGRGRGPAEPVRVLPAARGQHRGRDRGRRRAPQPRRPLGRRAQHPPYSTDLYSSTS